MGLGGEKEEEEKTDQADCSRRAGAGPTFLYGGVQLGDLHGQPVDTVLERVGAQIEGVGLVEQFAKYILRMFTWKRMTGIEKREISDQKGALRSFSGAKSAPEEADRWP